MPSISAPSRVRRVSQRRSPLSRARAGAWRLLGGLAAGPSQLLAHLRGRLYLIGARRALKDRSRPIRLCLGSGSAPIAGWTNVDISPPADVLLDLRFGLPLPDASVARIYSEHLIEHLDLEAGLVLLRECRRVLAEDGVLRFATPDLAALVDEYRGGWEDQDWVNWPEYRWIDSGVRMLNASMRLWGHQYLYDYDELAMRLRAAGFTRVVRCSIGDSEHEDLQGLETRLDSRLIIEASTGEAAS